MSYKQAVLRDNPLSFWPLDGAGATSLFTYANLLARFATYNDWLADQAFYSEVVGSITVPDVSNFGNHAAFTLGAPNFQDVLSLVTHASYDTNLSGCKITPNIGIEFPNIYAPGITNGGIFQSGYEQKTVGIEFWILMPEALNSTCNIMNLHAGADTRMKIYTNNDFMYFTLYFQGNVSLTTKKQIFSWDSPLHIFVSVKDRNMVLSVNGLSDESVSIPTSYQYCSDTSSNFAMGPTGSTASFTANGLALYDRVLSSSEIRNHMFWAYRDSNPVGYSNQTNVSHFTFDNDMGKTLFSKQFNNRNMYNQGTYNNTTSDKSGITLLGTDTPTSAIGTWTYPLSIASYENFTGVELSWDTGLYNDISPTSLVVNRSVVVSVSYDNGVTYSNVTNGKSFPYFLSNFGSSFAGQCLVKVTLYSADTSTDYQPRLDNLSIKVYSNINKVSDSGLFQFAPASSTTFMIKKDSTNILSRGKNLGVRFSAQDPGSKPGYAIISPTTSSSYQAVEFWMSYDGKGSAVLDTTSAGVDLYINSSNVLVNIAGTTLYVNGINRNSSPITLINGELYHVSLVYPTSNSSTILLNGSYDASKAPSEASYGYISIYPGTQALADVQSRYLSFISINSGVANNSIIYSGNSLIYNDSVTNSVGQLLEYSGTNSQINNGQPFTFHTHLS